MHRTQSLLATSAVSAVVKVDTLAGRRSPRQPLFQSLPVLGEGAHLQLSVLRTSRSK